MCKKYLFVIYIVVIQLMVSITNYAYCQANISVPTLYKSVSIGDYFYDDGTTSSKRILTKNCVGIVFTTETSEIEQSKGWTHGMIVALQNAGDFPSGWGGDYDHVSQECKTRNLALSDIDGYKHNYMEGDDNPGDRRGAFRTAKEYDVPLPASTSGWYLPSTGQWNLILRNLLRVDFDEKMNEHAYAVKKELSLINGNYWTSTEFGAKPDDVSGIGVWAWNICIYRNSVMLENACKYLVCFVRPVASF